MRINPCITDNMNEVLVREFHKEEIEVVIKSMAPLKAFGEDGFPALFYKINFWHIMGDEVSDFCIDILNRMKVVRSINNTSIILLPKVNQLMEMSQFRSINLCNVIYKIIAKAIVNRFRTFLDDCIENAKAVFVSSRQIKNNALIVYQILQSLKLKKRGHRGHFALKLDVSKTYDQIE